MDQLKEFVRQAIKYRFWIAVSLAALLSMIAYFSSGEIQAKSKTLRDTIESSDKGVSPYMSGKPVNADYAKVVSGKTAELTADVDESWKKLYDRQAPLLTWPERVQDRFTTWGRQWPKDVDSSAVRIAIIDYVGAYQGFVTEVYKSFKPFDYETGTGIVAAPPEEMLLRPAKFSEQEPPPLGKVWAAQERLWIQRTLLDVVATVNKNATNWDNAIIKEIRKLDAGSKDDITRDQRSVAHGEVLDLAPDINDPAKPPAPPPDAAAANLGSAGPGMAGMTASNSEDVYYIHTEAKSPFQVLPVSMTVLIDQDHIQDLLIALENSPMTIQVKDFELSKSLTRIEKPKQGAPAMNFAYGNPMFMNSSATPMTSYGGPMAQEMIMMSPSATGYSMDGGPAAVAKPKGKDVRQKNRAQAEKELRAQVEKSKGSSIHDPYYNIVEVKVYGQARFFNPPPVPAPSQSTESAATAPAPAPTEAAPAAATTAPASADGEKKPEAEKKADEPKPEAEKKADEPKPEAEKKADGERKPEAEKKTDEPKPEAEKKAEEPKPAEAAPAPK